MLELQGDLDSLLIQVNVIVDKELYGILKIPPEGRINYLSTEESIISKELL